MKIISADLKKTKMKYMMKLILSISAKIIVLVFLLDGILDFSYIYVKKIKILTYTQYSDYKISHENGKKIPLGSLEDTAHEWSRVTFRELPGLGSIPNSFSSPRVNIAPDGRRSNGLSPLDNPAKSGLLFGSSQALGYHVSDDQSLPAQIQKKLGNISVQNYASLGQKLSQTMMRWDEISKNSRPIDFVIIAGGVYDLLDDCADYPKLKEQEEQTRLGFAYKKIFESTASKTASLCDTPLGAEMAVEHSIRLLKETVSFGREKRIPFVIAILPTTFDDGLNTSNLKDRTGYQETLPLLKKVFSNFHQRLREIDAPEIIDLSQSIRRDQPYFLDPSGHLSGDGNEQLADALIKKAAPVFTGKTLKADP